MDKDYDEYLEHLLEEDKDKLTHQISASDQVRYMTIINESGLYSLTISSTLTT